MRGIKSKSGNRFSLKALTLAVAAVCTAGTAHAFKVDAGPDWDMQFDNTVQWTMGWRAESMNSKIGNNPFFQTGDYKFQHKGDMVTNRVQDFIEFQGTYQQNMGFRMSASIWKDFNYTDHVAQNPLYANAPGGGFHNYPGDKYNNYTKHYAIEGGDWLDGFVFYNTEILDHKVYAKVGRLAQYWGNAFFFGFSNIAYSQSPIDFIKAFTQPGSEVKELFLPRNQILVSADLTSNLSITGEYFLEYRSNLYPEAGTYFGFFDVLYNGPLGAGTGGAFYVPSCGIAGGPTCFGLAPPVGNHGKIEPPNNNHNYGVKLAWTDVPLIGGDLGFYYRQLDEVDPYPLFNAAGTQLSINNTGTSVGYSIYNTPAQKTKLVGISYEKTFGLISTGWELSTRHHTELASAFVPGSDGLGARGNITNLIGNTFIQLGGSPLWNSGILLAEFSYTHLNSITDNKAQANFVGNGAACDSISGLARPGTWQDGCATKNSLAVAMLFIPQWQQVWAGVDLEAPISYTYGVHGNPAYRASAFYQEGTSIYSFGLRAIYQQKHQLTLAYNGQAWRTNNTSSVAPGVNTYAGFGGAGPVGVNDRGWVSLQYKTSF